MMKKWLSVMLALVMVVSFTACAKEEQAPVSMDLTQSNENQTPQTEASKTDISQLAVAYFDNMPEHNYMISATAFMDVLKAGEAYTLLDIRSAADYEKGHLQGAVSLPWGTAIAEGLSSIPSDKPVFLYCYTGQTAGQAVMTLNLAGFDARSISLGWNFGISKVEGIDAYTTTEANVLTAGVAAIDADVQEAITAYYEGLADVQDTKYKFYKVDEADLKEMLDAKDSSIYVLSVRQAKDYAVGHIEGASNIPFVKGMGQSFSELPQNKKIIVYCYTGQTAGQVTAALRMMGYDAVSLNGGMGTKANAPQGWSNKFYPVVSEASLLAESLYTAMPDHKNNISSSAFMDLVKGAQDMTIIDARSAQDYEKGHFVGAINVPFGASVAENLTNIPQDKPVFVYCYTGQTASQMTTLLKVAGFDARNISLGWNFGLSKVDGIDAYTTTDATPLASNVTVISPMTALAIEAYFSGMAALAETEYKLYKISEDDLKAKIDAKDDSIVIVSARSADDYVKGHIEGAINIPFEKEMIPSLKELPRDKTIVVYCYTGQTAAQTTAILRLMGYKAVSLNGGMGTPANAPMGWANKGFPVTQ